MDLSKADKQSLNAWMIEDRDRIERLEDMVEGLTDLLGELRDQVGEQGLAELAQRVERVEAMLNATTTAERHAAR